VRDPLGQYVNHYVKEGNGRKSRTGNNHNGAQSSLRINTNFSPGKRKSVSHYSFAVFGRSESKEQRRLSGDLSFLFSASESKEQKRLSGDHIDAINAMRAHCAGDNSPEGGGNLIRRNKAPRAETMVTPVPDDSETSRSHSTPMTSRITGFFRMFLGNSDAPEEEGEYDEERFGSLDDIHRMFLTDHDAGAYSALPALPPDETIVIEQAPHTPDVRPQSTSPHGISAQEEEVVAETQDTEDAVPPSPHTNLQVNNSDEPKQQNTSQDDKELPPLPPPVPSAIDCTPADLGTQAVTHTSPAATDGPATSDDNNKTDVNEGGRV